MRPSATPSRAKALLERRGRERRRLGGLSPDAPAHEARGDAAGQAGQHAGGGLAGRRGWSESDPNARAKERAAAMATRYAKKPRGPVKPRMPVTVPATIEVKTRLRRRRRP
jgi:hypothetical protein